MLHSIELLEQAEHDIDLAYEWYEEQRPGLGDEFLETAERAFALIIANPYAYSFRNEIFRGCALKRFPYTIFYVIIDGNIVVASVFDMRRRPIY